MLPFDTCWNRVARAELHRQSLVKIWNGLDTSEVYESRSDIGDDGAGKFYIRAVNRDWLLPFSLEFGEMLYHLRSALDSCVYDAVVLNFQQNPPPNEEKWEFVFGSNPDKFEEAMRRMKKIIPVDVKGLIEAVQPYKGATGRFQNQSWDIGQTLEILNNWARIDRHRRLHLAGTAVVRGKLRLIVPNGMTVDSVNFKTRSHILENDDEVADFKIGNFIPGTQVNVQPDFTFDITVDEAPRLLLQEISYLMLMSVSAVRESFERHFGVTR